MSKIKKINPFDKLTAEQTGQYIAMIEGLREKLNSWEEVSDLVGVSWGSLYRHKREPETVSVDSYERVMAAYEDLIGEPPEAKSLPKKKGKKKKKATEEKIVEAIVPPEDRVNTDPPAEAHRINGNGKPDTINGVLDALSAAQEELQGVSDLLKKAEKRFHEYERLMALAYNGANPLMAKGIKATMAELKETHKLLEGTLV